MSGDGEDYSQDEYDEVYDALSEAFEEYEGGGGASGGGGGGGGEVSAGITVTAKIEWAGEYANNGRNGERTVNLNPTNLTAVRDAVARAQHLEGLAARGPKRSYTAKGWSAQLKQLTGTAGGRQALKDSGWNPSRETLRRYGHGTQAPSKANRARLAEAYENTRNPGRGWVEARKEAVDALTDALKREYGGSNIRFRDITDFRLT